MGRKFMVGLLSGRASSGADDVMPSYPANVCNRNLAIVCKRLGILSPLGHSVAYKTYDEQMG